MNSLHLKTGKNLKTFLTSVIDESVKAAMQLKSMNEKDKQDATTQSLKPAPVEDQQEKNASSKTIDADVETMKKGDIESSDIIEKLNAIRSGRSFKDEKVKATMEEYVGSLSNAEKTALFAFMKGIAQIVTGEIPAQNVTDPSDKPSDVSMKKSEQGSNVKHIKPNVIKAQIPVTGGKPSSEDTSAPVPITPKKK